MLIDDSITEEDDLNTTPSSAAQDVADYIALQGFTLLCELYVLIPFELFFTLFV